LPAYVAAQLVIVLLLTANVIVARNAMHRGRRRLSLTMMISSIVLAAVSGGIAWWS